MVIKQLFGYVVKICLNNCMNTVRRRPVVTQLVTKFTAFYEPQTSLPYCKSPDNNHNRQRKIVALVASFYFICWINHVHNSINCMCFAWDDTHNHINCMLWEQYTIISHRQSPSGNDLANVTTTLGTENECDFIRPSSTQLTLPLFTLLSKLWLMNAPPPLGTWPSVPLYCRRNVAYYDERNKFNLHKDSHNLIILLQ
jgi:hypothetical protein